MVYSWDQYILIVLKLTYNKNKLYKTLDYWSRNMLNLVFLEKGLGIIFLPHFVYNFSRKMLLMSHSVKSPNLIVWLPLLLEILVNIYIALVVTKVRIELKRSRTTQNDLKTTVNNLKTSKTTKNNQCINLTDSSTVFVLGFWQQVKTKQQV